MVKVGDYMVSEQKVAFTIMDFENLIDELKDESKKHYPRKMWFCKLLEKLIFFFFLYFF